MYMYTKEQIKDIIDCSLLNLTKDEHHSSAMTIEEINDLIKICLSKNRSDKSIKQFISGYISSHAIYTDIYDSSMEQCLLRKSIIKRYAHNIDLKHLKNDIYYKYDVKQGKNIMLKWHYKGGKHINDVVDELREMGIYIDTDLQTEQFFEFLEYLEKFKPTKLNKILSKEEIYNIVDSSFEYIINKKPFDKKEDIEDNKISSYDIDDLNIDDELFD